MLWPQTASSAYHLKTEGLQGFTSMNNDKWSVCDVKSVICTQQLMHFQEMSLMFQIFAAVKKQKKTQSLIFFMQETIGPGCFTDKNCQVDWPVDSPDLYCILLTLKCTSCMVRGVRQQPGYLGNSSTVNEVYLQHCDHSNFSLKVITKINQSGIQTFCS